MGLLGAAHGCGWGCSLRKICHTYPIVMKLGSYTLCKEGPKNL